MMSRAISRGAPYMRQFSRSITIMTDGACMGNGQVGAAAGIGVYFPDGQLENISQPLYQGRQTNQRAEIIAAIVGIRAARDAGYDNIRVELDSQYVKNAMDVWIHDWLRNDFRGVENKREFIRLYNLISDDDVHVQFNWIPRDQNKMADNLAKDGAFQARTDYNY